MVTKKDESRPAAHSSPSRVLAMPWRVANEFRRILALPYIRTRFLLHGVRWGHNWRILGMPILQRHGGSRIIIGDRVSMRSWKSSNPLAPNHPVVLSTRTESAEILIGDDCGFTGATIVADERVVIGNRVLVGANVTITDTDFHPLSPVQRTQDLNAGAHAPVVIDDDVFIGMNALILKGVHIGSGAVIGAGAVVTRDVPSRAIAAGNPAKVVGSV